MTQKLVFEEIQTGLAVYLQRAKVPGGWLVMAVDDVQTPVRDTFDNGYEWRSSICFVPDPEHTWLYINEDPENALGFRR